MHDLLNENETKELLNTLSKKWSISDKFLVSSYKFKSFQVDYRFILIFSPRVAIVSVKISLTRLSESLI